MKKLKGMLEGKKTYVTAVIGALTAIGAYLTGEVELADAARMVWVAVIAIFVRSGIESTKQK